MHFSAANAAGADLHLQGEYRRDALDYESTESEFYRLKAGLVLSGKSSMNVTAVHMGTTGEERYTWSLVLGDMSPCLSIILGNFQAGFGAGLLMGHRTSYNPDVFSIKEQSSNETAFVPVKSGNPSYAFNGAGVSLGGKFEQYSAAVHSFYSINERYLSEEGFFSGRTDNSLSTLENSRSGDYAHSEPVQIRTAGGMCSLSLLDAFRFQVSGLSTWITSAGGDRIRWDTDEYRDGPGGIYRVDGASLLAGYGDRYIRLFCESAASMTVVEYDSGRKKNIVGRGAVSGIRFTKRQFDFSFTGKYTGRNYYAPYGSTAGDDHPEQGCFLSADFRPLECLSIGSSAALEKSLSAGTGDSEPPVTRREEVHAQFAGQRLTSARFALRRYEKTSDGNNYAKTQYIHSDKFEISRNYQLAGAMVFQSASRSRSSALMAAGINCRLFRYARLSVFYCRAYIGGNNAVYAVTAPSEESSIPGMFIRESSDTGILKAGSKYENSSLSLRYLHQFTDGRTKMRRLEISGSGYF